MKDCPIKNSDKYKLTVEVEELRKIVDELMVENEELRKKAELYDNNRARQDEGE